MRGIWSNGPIVDPAAIAITGGTITGSTLRNGIPVMLSRSTIPFIGLSSGSVAAGGAITAITALPFAYPNAYCWFPANILAASNAAGWKFCQFSTTTAGTAFLDTYTSGMPTVPGAPTAVTAGQGAFTGDTTEEFGPTITVPANAIGANGQLVIAQYYSATNNANAKTGRIRYSGNAGTIFQAEAMASNPDAAVITVLGNCGVTNAQMAFPLGMLVTPTTRGVHGVIDTTASTTLVLSIQRATATDNLVLEGWNVQLIADGT